MDDGAESSSQVRAPREMFSESQYIRPADSLGRLSHNDFKIIMNRPGIVETTYPARCAVKAIQTMHDGCMTVLSEKQNTSIGRNLPLSPIPLMVFHLHHTYIPDHFETCIDPNYRKERLYRGVVYYPSRVSVKELIMLRVKLLSIE